MKKKMLFFTIIGLLASTFIYAEETKKEEVKKEEPKKEEPKKEEPKKEEPKKEEPKKEEAKKEEPKKALKPKIAHQLKECLYQANSLAIVDYDKFDDEVKKIQNIFDKCQTDALKEKEKELKAKECSKLKDEVKDKRIAVLKLVSISKISSKEEFEKILPEVKSLRDVLQKSETQYREFCQIVKLEHKKEEIKKVEVKKEEPKKEEPKKEEPKKEEPKKEEHK